MSGRRGTSHDPSRGPTDSGQHTGDPLSLTVRQGSGTPPFEQVRAHIARQARDGALPVGTRLPTVRAYAERLNLAVNTVARAYRELEAAGVIETRGRSGSFVAAADGGHARAVAAARDYAETVLGLGIDADEAVRIVAAALASHPTRGG